jgi:hypothetical protein
VGQSLVEENDPGSDRTCIGHERGHAPRNKRIALLEAFCNAIKAEPLPDDQRHDRDGPDSTAGDQFRRCRHALDEGEPGQS